METTWKRHPALAKRQACKQILEGSSKRQKPGPKELEVGGRLQPPGVALPGGPYQPKVGLSLSDERKASEVEDLQK